MLRQYRTTQRHFPEPDESEVRLVEHIVALATKYGRYGYKMITGLLKGAGWKVNHKRIERLWRQESPKIPKKQSKRGRLWLNDGSCIRQRPLYMYYVWSYDFMSVLTHDGRAFRILNVLYEHSRECLGCLVARRITHQDVIDFLALLFIMKGILDHLRSDNGPEFLAVEVRKRLARLGVKTLFIEPGSPPWEKGYI